MPLNPDFAKVRRSMRKKHGQKKGDEVFWKWVNSHKLDETKPLSEQKQKFKADDLSDMLMDILPDEFEGEAQPAPQQEDDSTQPWNKPPTGGDQPDPKPLGLGEAEVGPMTVGTAPTPMDTQKRPLHDALNRRPQEALPAEAADKGKWFSIPAFRTPYVAAPKFEGDDGAIIIKALVLEEGHNVNNWRVVPEEFQKVADQYKSGRQLRINHDKEVESIIGKSFDGKVMKGKDVSLYLGKDIDGIDPEGMYVAAEFEANPRDPQVRTNILDGYVVTGSIGLDAEAFCEKCDSPLKMDANGEMERTCHHLDAPVKLNNVEVKEYSYVAEPAFEHTQAFPSFSSAIASRLPHGNSSLVDSVKKVEVEMPEPTVALQAKAKAEGKADAEGDAEGKSEADAIMKAYKQGQADAAKMLAKFRADDKPQDDGDDGDDGDDTQRQDSSARAESEGESESEAKASLTTTPPKAKETKGTDPGRGTVSTRGSARTDQIGRVAPDAKAVPKSDLMSKIFRPTDTYLQDPALKELFKAAANTSPAAVKGNLMAVTKRFE